MPIYDPEEYEKVIARIQKKIAEKKIKMGTCVSEDTIVAFEKNCKIVLPLAYRMFLKFVGNGCDCGGFHLHPLEQIKQRDLSHPFMLEDVWVWEEDERSADIIWEEMQTKVYQGEIELIDFGCGNSYHLIVTGNCRGEVWNFTDVGAQPCCQRQDFLGWFELWLDDPEQPDFFKDYVYE